MKKLKQKEHHCEECGRLISEKEYLEYDCLCKECFEELT